MPQCFAYNKSLSRCDLEAGHLNQHSITIAWGDDECFDPHDVPPPPAPVIEYVQPDPTPPTEDCVACTHPYALHSIDHCTVNDCECFAFI